MKRIISLLLALLLAVPITANAAEVISTPSIEFFADENTALNYLIYDGIMQEGLYEVSFQLYGQMVTPADMYVTFSDGGSPLFPESMCYRGSLAFSLEGRDYFYDLDIVLSDNSTALFVSSGGKVLHLPSICNYAAFNLVSVDAEKLDSIEQHTVASAEYLRIIAGCLLFLTVSFLCNYVYKFFRIFF